MLVVLALILSGISFGLCLSSGIGIALIVAAIVFVGALCGIGMVIDD